MAKLYRDGNNDNDINNDNDDPCRGGHNDDIGFPVPFYAKPVQRQRWGSPDLVIHVGWNALVSSNEWIELQFLDEAYIFKFLFIYVFSPPPYYCKQQLMNY